MVKDTFKKSDREIEAAEYAIERFEAIKNEILSAKTEGRKKFIDNMAYDPDSIECLIDEAHALARINRDNDARKIIKRLSKSTGSRKRTWLYAAASIAAVVAVSSYLLWESDRDHTVGTDAEFISEVVKPTIVTSIGDDVIYHKTLDDGLYDITSTASASDMALREDAAQGFIANEGVVYQKIIVPKGYTYKVRLADGSDVTLNSGSELKFPLNYNSDSVRRVEFSGEGFFEIVASEKPFIVNAGQTHVTVYGTSFNMFYSESLGISEAVLVKGRIGMTAGQVEKIIGPDERVYCMLDKGLLHFEHVNVEDYIGWMGGSFKYNRARLDRIMYDISQWYGAEFVCDPDMADMTFSLELDKSMSLKSMAQAMKIITGIKVTIK